MEHEYTDNNGHIRRQRNNGARLGADKTVIESRPSDQSLAKLRRLSLEYQAVLAENRGELVRAAELREEAAAWGLVENGAVSSNTSVAPAEPQS
jgi:hypothetical protein